MDEILEQMREMFPDGDVQEAYMPSYAIWVDRTQWTVRFTGPDIDRTIQLDYKNSGGVFLCEDTTFPISSSALMAIHQLEREGYAYRDPIQTVYIDPVPEGEQCIEEDDPEDGSTIEFLLFKVGTDDRFGFVLQDNVIISPYLVDEVIETG